MSAAEDARHAYEQVHEAMQASDGLMRRMAADVDRIMRQSITVGALTDADRQAMMLNVDDVIRRTFGDTRTTAQTAELTRMVEQRMADTGVSHYQRAWNDLDTAMMQRDPALWSRVRAHIATAPLSEGDRLQRTYQLLYGPQVDRQRIIRERFVDPNRRWVNGSSYQLSDRVWKNGRKVRHGIDQRLQDAIRNGTPRSELVRELKQYLDPAYAEVRYQKNGKVLRTAASRGNPSATSAVRRLMRTEIAYTNGQATIAAAQDVPGIRGIRWRLSGSHPEFDECDEKATRDVGLGPGIYPVDDVPPYPTHPQDLCCLVHDHKSREETRQEIVNKYREELGLEPVETGSATPEAIPSQTPRPMTLQERLKVDEAEIRLIKDHERAILYDQDGNVLLTKDGGRSNVSFEEEEVMKMRGGILTHNHPGGWKEPEGSFSRNHSGFSSGDLAMFKASGLQEIRAISPGYVYSMRRVTPYTGEVSGAELQRAIGEVKQVTNRLADRRAKQYFKGTLDLSSDPQQEIAHAMAKKWGVEYDRTEVQP